MNVIKVLLVLCDFALNPRSHRDPDYIKSLSENMKAVGQQVPIIGYFRDKRFMVLDGSCRGAALLMGGFTEAFAIDLGKEPTRDEFLMAQASVDVHKAHLPPMDKARLYEAIIQTGKTARLVSQELAISESVVSRTRDLLKLCPELQERVNSGELDVSKAVLIARADPDKQLALAGMNLTGAQLREAVTEKPKEPQPKAAKIRLIIGKWTVTISGPEGLSIDDGITAMAGAGRMLREGKEAGYTSKTISTMSAEKSKAKQ